MKYPSVVILLHMCEVCKHFFVNYFTFVKYQQFMYEIFVQLCKEHGVSAYKVCKDLGISQGVISNWKNRGSSVTNETLLKLAQYFGVPMEYLLGADNLEIDGDTHTWEIKESYYEDSKAEELANFAKENKEYQVLFDTYRKVKPENIEKVIQMINLMFGEQ